MHDITGHPAARRFLDELAQRTAHLPSDQRDEVLEGISAHIAAGISDVSTEADVLNLLDSLGTPSEIANSFEVDADADASAPVPPPPPLLASAAEPASSSTGATVLSVFGIIFGVLAVIGVVLPPIGLILGIIAAVLGVAARSALRGVGRPTWPGTVSAALGTSAIVLTILAVMYLYTFRTEVHEEYGPVVEVEESQVPAAGPR